MSLVRSQATTIQVFSVWLFDQTRVPLLLYYLIAKPLLHQEVHRNGRPETANGHNSAGTERRSQSLSLVYEFRQPKHSRINHKLSDPYNYDFTVRRSNNLHEKIDDILYGEKYGVNQENDSRS